jgi:hypothetical protein
VSFAAVTLCVASQRVIPKVSVYFRFAGCAVWVRNLVSHFEGGTQTEGF